MIQKIFQISQNEKKPNRKKNRKNEKTGSRKDPTEARIWASPYAARALQRCAFAQYSTPNRNCQFLRLSLSPNLVIERLSELLVLFCVEHTWENGCTRLIMPNIHYSRFPQKKNQPLSRKFLVLAVDAFQHTKQHKFRRYLYY